MGLSNADYFGVFRVIKDKLQYLAIFKSFKSEIEEIFIQKLLKEIIGGWENCRCMPLGKKNY